MNNKRAIFAGTFDPPTNGHIWCIMEALKVFQTIRIVINVNPDKKHMFTPEERKEMFIDIFGDTTNRIEIDIPEKQFTASYAADNGINTIIRGIRNVSDLEYEKVVRNVNKDIVPKINMMYLIPPDNLNCISSSMVKGLIGYRGWVTTVNKYVPAYVHQAIKKKFPVKSIRDIV
jgi:pantetheine-phosphate adenylyltransferase